MRQLTRWHGMGALIVGLVLSVGAAAAQAQQPAPAPGGRQGGGQRGPVLSVQIVPRCAICGS